MDTLSLVLDAEHIIVTLTSPDHLPMPVFESIIQTDAFRPSWRDLYEAGELIGYPLDGASAAAFGLRSGTFAELYAHVELVDPDLHLWSIAPSDGVDPLGWITVDEQWTITGLWQVPAHFDLDDL